MCVRKKIRSAQNVTDVSFFCSVRGVRYLVADIAHRLPDEGQIIPTPEPHERVVFLTHFVHGLGFPLHPFVRGLMFYYGLDFHDLTPNFILNILAFIVVCEAFIRIRPHFGLWLKTFNVKRKVVVGQQAECGGAMVGDTSPTYLQFLIAPCYIIYCFGHY